MKKWTVMLLVLLLAMLFSAQSTKEKRPQFVEGELIVKLKSGEMQVARGLESSMNITFSSSVGAEAVSVFKCEAGKEQEVSDALRQRDEVEYAEPNYLYYASDTPNDPDFSKLWGMHNTGQTGGTADADIDAVEAWDIQKGDSTVLVAVIDTGVDYTHPDLKANIWSNPGETGTDNQGRDKRSNGVDDDNNGYIDDFHGWDFANNDNDPMDDNAHGTHVSGTIGAVGNNGVGVVGVNWRVKILPLKFLTGGGSGSTDDAIAAIEYASSFGAHVMSNSWGGGGRSQALENAIVLSNNAGSLFVAAAGNEGTNNDTQPNYPSNYDVPNVLAVAAIDHNGVLSVFGPGGGNICGCENNPLPTPGSNYGATTVDLAAPGSAILSTVPGGYNTFSGTSMATPHVAGVAALTLAQFPTLTNVQLKQHLMSSVDTRPSLMGKMVTGGSINAHKAVSVSPTL